MNEIELKPWKVLDAPYPTIEEIEGMCERGILQLKMHTGSFRGRLRLYIDECHRQMGAAAIPLHLASLQELGLSGDVGASDVIFRAHKFNYKKCPEFTSFIIATRCPGIISEGESFLFPIGMPAFPGKVMHYHVLERKGSMTTLWFCISGMHRSIGNKARLVFTR